MSESPETPEVDSPDVEATPVDLPSVDTAFVILRGHDGAWRVTTDIMQPFSIDRAANRSDVRIGTTEINHLISHQDLATLIAATLKASEETS
jgi:hypothetical protein